MKIIVLILLCISFITWYENYTKENNKGFKCKYNKKYQKWERL